MDATGNPDTEQYLILAQELMRRIYADDSSEAIHMWLQSQLAKMGTLGSETAALLWADSFAYYDALLEKRVERANLPIDERKELRWAWNTWNRMIDPLEPGLLCVIAAGDGVGKTIYAETQAEHWAKSGLKVDFIHFELNRAIMLDRRAARHTGISRRELKSGPFTPTIHREWHEARNRLSGWGGTITYWHAPGWSMEKVTRNLEQKVANGETDVVVIDYLERRSHRTGKSSYLAQTTGNGRPMMSRSSKPLRNEWRHPRYS
jgi:hypothetical protein